MRKIILLIIIASTSFGKIEAQVNMQDSLALVDLYNSTNGVNWVNTWNLANPVSTWNGVTVTNNNVTSLSLSRNNLVGSVPSSLGNITNLTSLILSYNSLTDSIPSSLGELSSLQHLELQYNQLTGSIPFPTLTNLNYLMLNHNQLIDTIPYSFANQSWVYLNVADNFLTGSLPTFNGAFVVAHKYISQGQAPTYLFFSNNHLSGTVPPIDTSQQLIHVYIDSNIFTFDGMEYFAQSFKGGFRVGLYSPQSKISIHAMDSTLSVYAGGTLSNNTYKWFKGDSLIATNIGDSTLKVNSTGNYSVAVTNAVATKLTLYSDTFSYERLPIVSIKNVSVTEGNGNTTKAAFKLKLDIPAPQQVTISYTTADGTAKAGQDYIAKSGVVIIDSGSNTALIKIAVIGDTIKEKNEKFYVRLSNPLNALLEPKDSGICIIKNDDKMKSFTEEKLLSQNDKLSIYPNPATDKINLVINGTQNETAQIEIIDMQGKILSSTNKNITEGASTQSINVSSLAKGNYFVRMKTRDRERTEKFVKE